MNSAVNPPAPSPADGICWLDATPERRRWFAAWLRSHWRELVPDVIHDDRAWLDADLDKRIRRALPELGPGTTGQMLSALDHAVRPFGFLLNVERVAEYLRWHLTSTVLRRAEDDPIRAVSPWANRDALDTLMDRRSGHDLAAAHYPDDPVLQRAFQTVATALTSTPLLPPDWQPDPAGTRLVAAVAAIAAEPASATTGPQGLTNFLKLALAKRPPSPLLRVRFDPARHLPAARRDALIRRFLHRPVRAPLPVEAAPWRVVLDALATDAELRRALVQLDAADAHCRRKRWRSAVNELALRIRANHAPSNKVRIEDAVVCCETELRKLPGVRVRAAAVARRLGLPETSVASVEVEVREALRRHGLAPRETAP